MPALLDSDWIYGDEACVDGGSAVGDRQLCDNSILARLPATVVSRLTPHLDPVRLARKHVLFRAHEPLSVAYFPCTAVVSFVFRLESGETLDVGFVGRDGLAGNAVFPGVTTMSCDGVVVVPGLAMRIPADILRRELLANETLHWTIGRFAQVLLGRSMQMSACNMFHPVEQRCIRWLLTVHDLIGQNEIPLTHDAIASSLGVHRPTVTVVIGALHRAGLLDEERGRIVIRDRDRLAAACCECYRTMRDEQHRLLGY